MGSNIVLVFVTIDNGVMETLVTQLCRDIKISLTIGRNSKFEVSPHFQLLKCMEKFLPQDCIVWNLLAVYVVPPSPPLGRVAGFFINSHDQTVVYGYFNTQVF